MLRDNGMTFRYSVGYKGKIGQQRKGRNVMRLFDFLKPKEPENVVISEFECKRGSLTVRGTEFRPKGDDLPVAIVSHGFNRKHDAIAIRAARFCKGLRFEEPVRR